MSAFLSGRGKAEARRAYALAPSKAGAADLSLVVGNVAFHEPDSAIL